MEQKDKKLGKICCLRINQKKQFFFSFQSATLSCAVCSLASINFALSFLIFHSTLLSPFQTALSLHLSLSLSFVCLFHFLFIGSVFPFEHFWSSGFRFSHTLSCHTDRPQKCRTVESVRGSGIPHAEGKHCSGQEGTQRSKQCTYPPQRYRSPLSTIISLHNSPNPRTLYNSAIFHCSYSPIFPNYRYCQQNTR